jgi:predicted SprT family Zn-dependent metalloprotease
MSITTKEYNSFQKAYGFFNRELFGSSLPDVLITLQRKGRLGGYFSPKRFTGRLEESVAHELALNPDKFKDQTDEWIYSVLVHEMMHVWQHTFGEPTRGRYHNREWAEKMKSIGLQPSSTGKPGGRETGQRMSHYIVKGGLYAAAYERLASTKFKLSWNSISEEETTKRQSKTKFTCPACHQNAWAKPDASLICGICKVLMEAPSGRSPITGNGQPVPTPNRNCVFAGHEMTSEEMELLSELEEENFNEGLGLLTTELCGELLKTIRSQSSPL